MIVELSFNIYLTRDKIIVEDLEVFLNNFITYFRLILINFEYNYIIIFI